MESKKIEIELPKESYELAVGLGKFAAAVKQSLHDGWQVGEDLPAMIAAALNDLVPSVQGFEKIDEEAKLAPLAVGQALLEGLKPVFIKQP